MAGKKKQNDCKKKVEKKRDSEKIANDGLGRQRFGNLAVKLGMSLKKGQGQLEGITKRDVRMDERWIEL